MAKFKIAVTQTFSQVFIVEAQDSSKAIEKISDAWDNGEIELDNPEISDTDFSFIERTQENARAML